TVDNDSVLNRYVIHNENYNAARRLDFKSKSLARRGAWRSQSQSAPGRRRDLLSRLIEHHYPPAQIPVNGLLPQPRRRAVRHGSDGQQGIEQRLIVSVDNLQSDEWGGPILDPGEKRRLRTIDRRGICGRNQGERSGGLALGCADEVAQEGQGETRQPAAVRNPRPDADRRQVGIALFVIAG